MKRTEFPNTGFYNMGINPCPQRQTSGEGVWTELTVCASIRKKMKSKYIVYGAPATPIVFPETLNHNEVADRFARPSDVVGAGFCYIEDNKYVCYGESYSLKIKSRGELDSKVLNFMLGAIET